MLTNANREQFDKLLELMRHDLSLLAERSLNFIPNQMSILAFGGKTSTGEDFINLYRRGFHTRTPLSALRIDVAYMMKAYWTASTIGIFWYAFRFAIVIRC